jgi:hypothetical protein
MLHRNCRFLKLGLVILLIAIPCGTAWSQLGDEATDLPARHVPSKKPKGPRALGVIEFAPNGKARLIPITILIGDQWYDAGVYMASPRPMALDPETIYEGEESGAPEGLFTVTGLQQRGANWIGLGSWKPMSSIAAVKKKTSEPPAKSEIDLGDERPVLRRAKSADSDSESKPAPAPPAANPAPPAATPAPTPSSSSQAEQKTAEAKPAPVPAKTDEDNARPILRRGKPGQEQADSISMPSTPDDFAQPAVSSSASSTAAKLGAPLPKAVTFRMLAAISDAGGPEPHSYVYETNPTEREDYNNRVAGLASDALRKFMATRAPGQPVPAVTPDNSQVRIFDLGNNNEPVLVLTAQVPRVPAVSKPVSVKRAAVGGTPNTPEQAASSVEYYVTLVARVDVTGDLRQLFASVTDSTRLDAYPKLDLVDAVDANGDGVGELLFRETYDRSREFVLYRAGMDQLWKLFEGAQSGF